VLNDDNFGEKANQKMNEDNSTTVEIFGREYRIRGVADESYIRSVAKYVDEKMKEVSRSTSLPSQDRLAILTALNIADELFQQREASSQGYTSIAKETDKLIRLLDESIQVKE
jgi:cell division protein ZapA